MILRTTPAARTAAAQAVLALLCGAAAHAQTTETTLPSVTISAGSEQESATGPVQGFVARRALSATKTDTPLIETPQAITVVTRDQMEAQGVQTLRESTRYSAGIVSSYFDSRVDSFKARGGDVTQYLDGLMRTYGTYN
ncbi:MAG: TonB-dependent receptor plug domain-containing protein, partial [Burkholderiaceae bacterium]